MTRTLYDHTGQALTLGPVLASGGEGSVFRLADGPPAQEKRALPALLAKLYHDPPDSLRVQKLRWMATHADPELCQFSGWPTATLHDTPGGPLVGFLMPHFEGYRPIHMLYSPAHRRTCFPQADWAFLAHVARNCAAAFDSIHNHGHLVGDVNQSNVLVSPTGLVGLIDCDSFQVRDGDTLYLCEVGVGQYTPPELQGRSFRGLERTANHDRFGLAVLLFHLLFMGRHPYAGRFLGQGELSLEQSIQEFRFVYSEQGPAMQMAPPPHTLPLRAVGKELAALFERAFASGSEKDGARPTAAEWHACLSAFLAGMRPCPRDPGHKVPAHLTDCPWCGIVENGGPNFFLGVGPLPETYTPDQDGLARILRRAEAVKRKAHPQPKPALPPGHRIAPARPGGRVRLGRRTPEEAPAWCAWAILILALVGAYWASGSLAGVTGLWSLLLFGLWWWVKFIGFFCAFAFAGALARGLTAGYLRTPWQKERRRRQQAQQETSRKLAETLAEWQPVVQRYANEHKRLGAGLKALKSAAAALEVEFRKERAELLGRLPRPRPAARGSEEQAREEYLRSQFINEHKIPGIGPSRSVLLASYGVETAFDLTEQSLESIRGIGPALRRNLLAWRESVLAEFHFESGPAGAPAEGPAPPSPELQALVLRYKQREESLRSQLQKTAIDLEALDRHTEEELQGLRQRVESAFAAAVQAEVDFEAVS